MQTPYSTLNRLNIAKAQLSSCITVRLSRYVTRITRRKGSRSFFSKFR
ncbi:hypothetical protein HMPREF0201_03399 [Cedecea davisae DSM 4568]|uniref:Uncharacterized protein n=1 Tax=Cedecea davisae DSM 4568 TaxID=566551 RepID=S3INQ5_9ENTR|nr:hypothetical protein HMPREF0201_03399 [Cedecea davisae DSM 4568]